MNHKPIIENILPHTYLSNMNHTTNTKLQTETYIELDIESDPESDIESEFIEADIGFTTNIGYDDSDDSDDETNINFNGTFAFGSTENKDSKIDLSRLNLNSTIPIIREYYNLNNQVIENAKSKLFEIYSLKNKVESLYLIKNKRIKFRYKYSDHELKIVMDDSYLTYDDVYINGLNIVDYFKKYHNIDVLFHFGYGCNFGKTYFLENFNTMSFNESTNAIEYFFDKNFNFVGYIDKSHGGIIHNFNIRKDKSGCNVIIHNNISFLLSYYLHYNNAQKCIEFKCNGILLYCRCIGSDEEYDYELDETNYINYYEIVSSRASHKKYPKFDIINPTIDKIIITIGELLNEKYYYYKDGSIMYDGEYFLSKQRGKVKIDYNLFSKIKSKSEMEILKLIDIAKKTQILNTTSRGSFKRTR
jgi:hypothetical protein